MKKLLPAFLISMALLLAVTAYAFYSLSQPVAPVADTGPQVQPDSASATTTATSSETFSWRFEDQCPSTAPDCTPLTKVTLVTGSNGKLYPAGVYTGTCSVIDQSSAWRLLPGELSGAMCYYAGSGTELGVFDESGKLVLKQAPLDEGTAEVPSLRGDFSTTITPLN